jgi:hypothetical protein
MVAVGVEFCSAIPGGVHQPTLGLGSWTGRSHADLRLCRGAALRVSRFTVPLHDATREHYAIRLEYDGVIASWAVKMRDDHAARGSDIVRERTQSVRSGRTLDDLRAEGSGSGRRPWVREVPHVHA